MIAPAHRHRNRAVRFSLLLVLAAVAACDRDPTSPADVASTARPTASLTGATPLTASDGRYDVTALDRLGGTQFTYGGINSSGDAVAYGWMGTPGGTTPRRAILWPGDGGAARLLSLPPLMKEAAAFAINESGDVAGWVGRMQAGYPLQGVVWKAGGVAQPVPMLAGSVYGIPYAINNAGAMAGDYYAARGEGAMIWPASGPPRSLTFPPGLAVIQAHVAGINDAEDVVGFVVTQSRGQLAMRAVLWPRIGTPRDLGAILPGAVWSFASGINSQGDAVGYYYPPGGGNAHAVVWPAAGGYRELGVFPGAGTSGIAYAINGAGDVVGMSGSRPVIWPHGGSVPRDLGTVGGPYGAAQAISELGEVLGWSCDAGCANQVPTRWSPAVDRVTVTPGSATLSPTAPGNTGQLTASLFDAAGNPVRMARHTVTWASSNTDFATVDANGLVTAGSKTGSATVTATSEGKSGTATITVNASGTYTLLFSALPVGGGITSLYTQVSGSADASRVRFTTGDYDQAPRWSPNAQRFLFTSGRAGGGTWELYAMDATPGAATRRITTAGGLTNYGDFSPLDPSTVVFMRGYRIWKMNIDAPNPEATAVQITTTPFDETQPKWSPDGRWITWVRQPRAGTDVWVMNANDPSQASQVTDLGDYARHPSWSPSSTRIVFSRFWDIYVADVIDNSNPANPVVLPLANVRITRLTFDGDYNDMPVWSPDGRKIAWSKGGAQSDLFLMNTDGTRVEHITSTPDIHEQWPAFKPF